MHSLTDCTSYLCFHSCIQEMHLYTVFLSGYLLLLRSSIEAGTFRLVNGENAAFDDWSFVVPLNFRLKGTQKSADGSGTLLRHKNELFILTAAHIFGVNITQNGEKFHLIQDKTTGVYYATGVLLIQYGSAVAQRLSSVAVSTTFENKIVSIPAEWVDGVISNLQGRYSDFSYADFALIKLSTQAFGEIYCNTNVEVYDFSSLQNYIFPYGTVCSIISWGSTTLDSLRFDEKAKRPDRLKKAKFELVDHETNCHLNRSVPARKPIICLKPMRKSNGELEEVYAGPGDSGAPIMCQLSGKQPALLGVTGTATIQTQSDLVQQKVLKVFSNYAIEGALVTTDFFLNFLEVSAAKD